MNEEKNMIAGVVRLMMDLDIISKRGGDGVYIYRMLKVKFGVEDANTY